MIRVGLVYIVASWVIIQVAQAVFPALLMPDWTVTLVVALCVLGFPVAIILAWAYQVKPDSSGSDEPSVQLVVDRGRKVDFVIIAALAVGVVILAYELYVRQETRPPPVDTGQATDTPESISDDLGAELLRLPAIAVLPFDNLTGDPENQNISDGIVEELLIELVRIKELRVVGRKASFYYRDKTEDWRTIAATLGATMIIEGSIRRFNGRIRVSAQLIDRTGYHMWGENYDVSLDKSLDILDVQRDIATQVAYALPIDLSDESKRVLEATPTDNDEAYQLYMQGRTYLRTADHSAEYQSAVAVFRNALELDPDFTDALSGLCEAQLKIFTISFRPQDYAAATSTCSRLMNEDNINAYGYIALGDLNRLSGNYEEAKLQFEKALALEPTAEPALYGLARCVEGLGDYEGARQYYDESVRLAVRPV